MSFWTVRVIASTSFVTNISDVSKLFLFAAVGQIRKDPLAAYDVDVTEEGQAIAEFLAKVV